MITVLVTILAFVVAMTIHEFAHALAADRLGDPTAKIQGRLSLNPLAHLDILGSVLVPGFLILTGSPILFGWAKPVQFDPYNLKNPRKDAALISLAGPLSNLLLALVLALVIRLFPFSIMWLAQFVVINVILAIFNLIPIHPLDGGKILVGFLPREVAWEWDQLLNRYGLLILLALIFPFGGQSLLSLFLYPIINLLLGLFLPGNQIV